jgi:hypothetical protein
MQNLLLGWENAMIIRRAHVKSFRNTQYVANIERRGANQHLETDRVTLGLSSDFFTYLLLHHQLPHNIALICPSTLETCVSI